MSINMSRKLAIKGHPTRGKEVIGLLMMMGGKSTIPGGAILDRCIYTINKGFVSELLLYNTYDYAIFTLEEFLEEYPFKINDFVNIPGYVSKFGICGMRWDPTCEEVEYLVYPCSVEKWYTKRELLKYNDNPNKPSKCMDDKAKAPDMKGEDYSEKRFGYKIPDGYEFDTIDNDKIILKPIKPKYPDNYEDCVRIAKNIHGYVIHIDTPAYSELLESFVKLLICRDAYWKIAGEQMGLDGPWKADFTQDSGIKYLILFANGEVIWNRRECESVTGSRVLAFPTKEMRNAFYENFKDLIEKCKELL